MQRPFLQFRMRSRILVDQDNVAGVKVMFRALAQIVQIVESQVGETRDAELHGEEVNLDQRSESGF